MNNVNKETIEEVKGGVVAPAFFMQYEKSNYWGVQMDTLRKCKLNPEFLLILKILYIQ